MYKKYLFLLSLFIFSIFTISPALAQSTENDLDQKCFTQAECKAARAEMGVPIDQQGNGFYYNTAETRTACKDRKDENGTELGFCLPAGQTSTSVKFGGVSKFANIAVFIQFMYRYGVIFAGILAVIVIIIAGLQWTASGGNSSTIESAKKRIAGAVTGLILASASYIILNTINPSTLNLRLPQIWMIRGSQIENSYKYCMAIPATAQGRTGWVSPKIAPFQDNYQAIPAASFQDAFTFEERGDYTDLVFPLKKESSISKCGEKMYIQGTEGNSCIGTYCQSGFCFDDTKLCLELPVQNGGIAGRITWEPGKFLDEISLKVACEDGDSITVEDIEDIELGEAKQYYFFLNIKNKAIGECGSLEKIKGYFFVVQANDSDSGTTNDDEWIGGRSFCTLVAGNSCGFYGESSIDNDEAEKFIGPISQIGELFSPLEIHGEGRQGLVCDLKITKESMPNLGDGAISLAFSGAARLISEQVGDTFDAIVMNGLTKTKPCEYLKKQDAKFDQAIEERRRARNAGAP